ncbi:hypothetical protein LRS11_19230 [Pseudomonas sp. J452]|uniref:hypothetical protein n=1 Tax=Pseudomonas sp. J452 TaxID=2898441 RepID=UPI0021AE228B|nr:hypothetical protein [Pseudomonas sp. J452]UUY07918.1 hypothetical protein LRS11_19230 [Pseudomonas sp. J452]
MTARILYLATADARGHLMRAQLLTHALRAKGADVTVLTTSDEGVAFLAEFGIAAEVLSRHYAVQFDEQQNMQRAATDRTVARYLFDPRQMLRDIWRLRRYLARVDLLVNDSFHPALLVMGCLPGWRRKIVHVYGASLRQALQSNFHGRLPAWLARAFAAAIAFELGRARARLQHDFAYLDASETAPGSFNLPTPVALAERPAGLPASCVALYLNPHFRDPALAAGLEKGLAQAGLASLRVGEGYAGRAGWLARDPRWIDAAAHSALIISAPGMAALSVAQVYRRPILLLVSDQPEQLSNARRAAELGLCHEVLVWRGDVAHFAEQLAAASRRLTAASADEAPGAGQVHAQRRLDLWVDCLLGLPGSDGKGRVER